MFRVNEPKIEKIPSFDKVVIHDKTSCRQLCSTERVVLLFRNSDNEYFAISNNKNYSIFLKSDLRKCLVIAIKNPDRYDQLRDAPIFQIL